MNLERLTEKEREIFDLLMLGFSDKQMANYLGVKIDTAAAAIYRVRTKFGGIKRKALITMYKQWREDNQCD